jgi:RHS repeat-associated protein
MPPSTFAYDTLNRVTGLSSQPASYSYQRGPAGNLTQGTESNGRSVNWSYDGIYRLSSETISLDPSHNNGSVSYGLDPVGNRLSENSSLADISSGSWNFNADDHLSSETYDANGNVTSTGGKTFSYNSQNQMVSMTASGTSASIAYDAFGNRVAKTLNGVTTRYLVDDLNPTGFPQVFDELNGSTVTRTYTYGLQRISQEQVINNTWTPSFYGYDGGGNVRQLTNSAGAVTDSYEYDAFGNEFTVSGSTPNEFMYRGEQYDSDLGLYYLRARYYNPLTGRFVSRDPGSGELTNPETLHKYLYADAEPVNGIDPTGWQDAEVYSLVLSRVSVSAATVTAVRATGLAIACLYLWDATKFYSAATAGPYGTIEQVAPCLWIPIKNNNPPAPPPPVPFPIPGTPPSPWPPRCKDNSRRGKCSKGTDRFVPPGSLPSRHVPIATPSQI